MWDLRVEQVEGGQRCEILRAGSGASFREVFDALETDREFRSWYTGALAGSGFEAFFWEHPPLSTRNQDAAAEFVLLDGPALARLRPDAQAFRDQFEHHPREAIISCPNLGGDAVLVVPRAIGPESAYAHLAAFLRLAPPEQIHGLWQRTARAVRERLGSQPAWLSTAGLGVPWLHVRIDSVPKYYRFAPYRSAAPSTRAGTGVRGAMR